MKQLAVVPFLFLVAGAAAAQEAPSVPCGVSEPCPGPVVSIVAGGVASVGAGADTGVRPLVHLAVDLPLAEAELTPRAHFTVALAALPGESLQLEDPATYRSVTFAAGLSQQLSRRLYLAVFAEVGFASRLGNDPAPRVRAPRYWTAGLRFARFKRGRLQLGCGFDQRLSGDYVPACVVSGALRLYRAEGGPLDGGTVQLIGEAILGLNLAATWPGVPSTDRPDVVLVGIGVGR